MPTVDTVITVQRDEKGNKQYWYKHLSTSKLHPHERVCTPLTIPGQVKGSSALMWTLKVVGNQSQAYDLKHLTWVSLNQSLFPS